MLNRLIVAFSFALLLTPTGPADAALRPAGPSLQSGTVIEAAEKLEPGQFLWAPQVAPQGPVLLVVSVKSQRAVVYRNGIPIGISTVSTGRPGYETPTGAFVILQKHVEHYSSKYDNAPMPYMQRLTWGGIALHGGNLPGYPASHGCIRLPHDFARLLYQVTHRGMTVIITDRLELPHVAPAEVFLGGGGTRALLQTDLEWNPGRAPDGPLSIVISAADRRVAVLRAGVVIGSSKVEIDGPIEQPSAFLLEGVVEGKRNWVRVPLPGQKNEPAESLRGRIRVPDEFRALIDPVVKIGTVVIVTNDPLQHGDMTERLTVVESDRPH